MEAAVALALGTVLLFVLVSPVVAFVALVRLSRLERRLEALSVRISAIGEAGVPAPPATHRTASSMEPPPRASPPSGPIVSPPVAPAPPEDASEAASVPSPAAYVTAPERGAMAPPGRSAASDFATSIGPRILVAAGGLAVVVFLGFFVRYAWENDWVGPAGRVLMGAVFSLALTAAGLRQMRGVYRPLGQGLAAAGFAGLYVSAYAAHGFYDLVPRGISAAVMIAATVCAVAVADRLGARLLATVAWTGGYLTPVLVSTGEDRAESLFSYLLLLGAGALWLDRRKPWPETLALAFAGTLLLYGGWYGAHFRAERFTVAAVGLVVLTGLFALGAARKKRAAAFAVVLLAAAVGLAALGTGADRPASLLLLSLALVAAGLLAARSFGAGVAAAGVAAAGAVGAAMPFVTWAAAHYRAESFGVAAAWLVGAALLLILGAHSLVPDLAFPAMALVGGGVATIDLAARTDRPLALLVLLLAQAGLAVLARRRWDWAEAAGVGLGALAVLSWFRHWFEPDRGADALALVLVFAGVYVVALAVRGLVAGVPLGRPEAATQIVAAACAWHILDSVLGLTGPRLLGPAAAALAAVHLVLGLAARRAGPEQQLWARVTLALAAFFLTLAIPVQLGLFGTTLAWAGEALVLLWLGLHHDSRLARAGGYAVLALAVGRLLQYHLPLHQGLFTPVLNAVFGTWLLVIVAVGTAGWLTSPLREGGSIPDRAAATILGPLALALLFGLLTAEARSIFEQRAQVARAAGRAEEALVARRQAGLALSVLWTVFATSLLGAGLALRSRGLFYTAYGLFAVTAFKVVLIDLATMPTLYRMLSFLALGVLLLAGAWLNLRFRERLVTPGRSGS